MFLNLQSADYDKDIAPFVRNGVLIDTSVLKIIIDGIITTRISKKKDLEFENILFFIDMIKMSNRWSKFLITPHILTEVCTHLRNDYNKHTNYKEIVEEIMPIIAQAEERNAGKKSILEFVDFKNPIIEIGDISIFVVADNFVNNNLKVSILANDEGLNRRYQDSKKVLVMDYKINIQNLL